MLTKKIMKKLDKMSDKKFYKLLYKLEEITAEGNNIVLADKTDIPKELLEATPYEVDDAELDKNKNSVLGIPGIPEHIKDILNKKICIFGAVHGVRSVIDKHLVTIIKFTFVNDDGSYVDNKYHLYPTASGTLYKQLTSVSMHFPCICKIVEIEIGENRRILKITKA